MRRVYKYLVIFLTLILPLLLCTSCSFSCTLPSAEPAPPSTPTSAPPAITHTTTPIDPDWALLSPESQAPPLPSIADVVAKVKPSVVAINTKVTGYDWFNQPITQEGAGSGWIIREDGIIVTNNHVVEGADSIAVTLDNGKTFVVDINKVATDWLTDLAVLKIDAENLPAVILGCSELRVGDWVVAIGNSLGMGISVKEGIISRKGVSLEVEGRTRYNLLETSAAINPGNSGGPLVDMAGEVIGITSAKVAASGVEGMGYAISSLDAAPIIQELVNTGYIVRPWLGVEELLTVNLAVASWYGLSVNEGVLVRAVTSDGPAAKAEIMPGDVIVSLDSTKIDNVEDLEQAVHSSQIGQEVEITVWRGDSKSTTYATLAESPPP